MLNRELKRVNYYKHSLLKGIYKGFNYNDQLQMTMEDSWAYYITPMYDTKDYQGSFNRLVLEGDFSKVKLEVVVAATDHLNHSHPEGFEDLGQYFSSPNVKAREKVATLKKLSHSRSINAKDMLLHDIKGRYVWVFIAVHPLESEASCLLEGFQLQFPKLSFTQYLPEIYQENQFFDRYIGVFQSLFLDEEEKVAQLPNLLDYETAPDNIVEELASWVGIDNKERIFSTQQLREIIKGMDLFQGCKGTKKALEAIIELATGITPIIVENFKWNTGGIPAYRQEMYGNLYGSSYNDFCVIMDISSGYKLPINDEKLGIIIENYTMVGTGYKLVKLERCPHSDTHCYLDINSVLSTPQMAETSGIMLGSHITMG